MRLSPVNIRGHRFGELEARFPFERGRRGIRWACRCDCGRWAIRTVAALRGSVRAGHEPCCERCSRELWGGIVESNRRAAARRRPKYRRLLIGLWNRHRTLYSDFYMRRMESDIATSLETELGIVPDNPDEQWAREQIERYGKLAVGGPWWRVGSGEDEEQWTDEMQPGTEAAPQRQSLDTYDPTEPSQLEAARERFARRFTEQVTKEEDAVNRTRWIFTGEDEHR